jgi:solute carrier family 8 (sodium/calcium exchanger)
VTAFIGDLATAFGCAAGMGDLVTAITIVALGTSLPDTFASKAAALHDRHADASIGNVTGSNSVNVFLGLGLPWLLAGIYWEVRPYDAGDATDPWNVQAVKKEWSARILQDYPGKFVVLSDGLGASVVIYTTCAILCLGTLVARRRFVGAELGGPLLTKWASAAFFVFLWIVYVVLSIVFSA